MHLHLSTHNLEISFNCDDEDHYDHSDLLKLLASLINELEHHTNVDLVVTSKVEPDDSQDDSWAD